MLLTDVRSLVSAVQINKIAIVDLTRFWLKFENAITSSEHFVVNRLMLKAELRLSTHLALSW